MAINVLISTPSNFNNDLFPPYSWGVLKTYCDSIAELRDSVHWLDPLYYRRPAVLLLEGVDLARIDVLGLSCYIWNSKLNYEVARLVREANPRCLIVAGGPDVPHGDPQIFQKHPYLDLIVKRDGEIPFAGILRQVVRGGRDFTDIPGLLIHQKGAPLKNTGEPLKPTIFDQSAYVTQNSVYQKVLEKHRQLYEDPRFICQLETSRGCPYLCAFCDWAANTGTKMRVFDMEKVRSDIEWMGQNRIQTIIGADSNFGFFDRDVEVAKLLVATNQKYGYPKSVHFGVEKRSGERIAEISKILFAAGMIDHFCLSIEHLDIDVLQAMQRVNLTEAQRLKLVGEMRAHHIPILSQLIFGAPNDSLEKLQKCVSSLIEQGADDEFVLYPFMVLPNARAAQPDYREKWNVRTRWMWTQVVRRNPVLDPQLDGVCEVIVGSNSYEPEEYVHMMTYANMMIAFHSGALTKFLCDYAVRCLNVSVQNFYAHLYEFLLRSESPNTEWLRLVHAHNRDFVFGETTPSLFEMTLPEGATMGRPELVNPEDFLLWKSLIHIESTYDALEKFMLGLAPEADCAEIQSVIHFQRSLMITPDYNSALGRKVEWGHNWPEFFHGEPLQQLTTFGHLTDTSCGTRLNYPLDFHQWTGAERMARYFDAVIGFIYHRMCRTYLRSWRAKA